MKRLLGIYREREYSPGRHEDNDRLLLESISQRLRACGLDVSLATIDQLDAAPHAQLIFSMCQGRTALDRLMEWERAGRTIINSPLAARKTHRDALADLMREAAVAFPETRLVATNGKLNGAADSKGPLWLKRGDVHASIAADVQRIQSRAHLDEALSEFQTRGIATAAVQAHCEGDELKFYGIGDGDFLYWYYSSEPHGHSFDAGKLAEIARRAAAATGLDIYGGDVIVSADGALTLIDLNDWPSFAPCRDAAADAIANLIRRRVHAD